MPARAAFICWTVFGSAAFELDVRGVELTAAGREAGTGVAGAALGVYVVTPFDDLTPGVAAGAGAAACEPGVYVFVPEFDGAGFEAGAELDRGVYVVAGFDGAGFDDGAGLVRGVYVVAGLAGLLAGGVEGRSVRAAAGGLLGVDRAGGV